MNAPVNNKSPSAAKSETAIFSAMNKSYSLMSHDELDFLLFYAGEQQKGERGETHASARKIVFWCTIMDDVINEQKRRQDAKQ